MQLKRLNHYSCHKFFFFQNGNCDFFFFQIHYGILNVYRCLLVQCFTSEMQMKLGFMLVIIKINYSSGWCASSTKIAIFYVQNIKTKKPAIHRGLPSRVAANWGSKYMTILGTSQCHGLYIKQHST